MSRLGACEKQHAIHTVERQVRNWIKDRENYGADLSTIDFETSVYQMMQAITKDSPEFACQFVNCEGE